MLNSLQRAHGLPTMADLTKMAGLMSTIGSFTSALAGLALVLALVLIAARAARAFGLAAPRPPAGAGRRLALLESLPLDPRRRLLLARCDGQEVLILTGGPQDVLLPVPRRADGAAP